MSATGHTTMHKYVQVLELRAQQAQTEAAHAQLRLQRTHQQLERLQQLGQTAELKKTATSVALYANAAGFRSGVVEMVAQCRDACSVQQLELEQAQMHVQQTMKRHASMHGVWLQAHEKVEQAQARKAQKSMDEMAAQAWMRARKVSQIETESR